MNKRKLASFLTAFLLGAGAAAYGRFVFSAVFFAFIIWQVKICREGGLAGKRIGIYMAVLFIAFAAGAARSQQREMESRQALSFFTQGEDIKVCGKLYQKEKKNKQYYYYLKNCTLHSVKGNYFCPKFLVIQDGDVCSVGKTIVVKGKTKVFNTPYNEGGYNEKAYYQSLNIEAAIEGGMVEKQYGNSFCFLEKLYRIRMKFGESFEKCMKHSHAGVMAAMTLGDKGGMDKGLKTLYQKAGVSHFYSISGIHLSILGMALFHFLRKMKCSYWISGGAAGGIICCYGCLTGFGISNTRAIGMFLILLYGKCRGKSYDCLTALCLLASLMVWENPKILSHAGFLLSFGAVAGVLLAQEVKKRIGREEKISGIKDTLLVSFCIQLCTIPILCNSFYEISLYSVFVNLFILPCMGFLLGLGLLGGAAGCFSVLAGKVLLFPCGLILWMFETVCTLFLKLPWAVFITGKLPVWRVLFWYICILVFLVLKKGNSFGAYLCKGVLCMGTCIFLLLLPIHRESQWNILDVGQGDGICFMEEDGTTMFLDGGSTSVSSVGTYRILPFLKYHGIKSVDYWFVSHLDEDHISGLREAVEGGYKIRHLVMAQGVVRDEAWENIVHMAHEAEIPVLYMKQNSRILGRNGAWSVTCLYPGDDNRESDRNHASLVLLCESAGFYGLFTGDLSKEQEQELVRTYELPEIHLLKVSHHGSKYGTCEELLRETAPKTAVISCGKNNRYGHPGEETLKRLKDAGAAVYDTRFDGQVKIICGEVK